MRRILYFLIFLLCFTSILAEENREITVKTNVNEATVFITGARVVRNKKVEIPAGKSVIKFNELSPYLDAKTINVVAKGSVTVLSVFHQFNYVDSAARSEEVKALDKKISDNSNLIKLKSANISVINEQFAFLRDNRILSGKNEAIDLANLKESSKFFKESINELKLEEIELTKQLEQLSLEQYALNKQREQLASSKPTAQSEILVKLDAKTATQCDFELSYYVSNAGWFPTYDLRANNINDPIELTYKANIRQNTKEDWKNVKLKLSSTDPKTGSIVPQLQTYYLNYNSRAPKYNKVVGNEVYGVVYDSESGEAMPGVTIQIAGTTIGTVTDIDGRYSLSIPNDNAQLIYSFIGYVKEYAYAAGSPKDIYLKQESIGLDDVVVIGYGTQRRNSDSNTTSSSALKKSEVNKSKSITMPVVQNETTTSFEFEIKTPYTILSNNKTLTVEMDNYSLETSFEYFSVPKVDKDAFLIANITKWERLNLLDGEANLFYENSYVGKTVIDTRSLKDTLNISFGRDRGVVIKRDKSQDYTSKPFIGQNKSVVRDWLITVKNNKSNPISLTIFDQVPVSTTDEIEVSTVNISKGEINKDSGEVTWKLKLEPAEKRELNLKYEVKYPKSRNLIIE